MTDKTPAIDTWIDQQNTLNDFLDAIEQAPAWMLDTEFLRTRTYYPRLCLIQISVGNRHGLIDTRADLDLSALTKRLRDPRTLVMHACLQDVEILHHDFDLIPSEVFDTQIAWGLLGHDFQISYAAMVKKRLDIELDKSQVRSRWDRRPLSPEQLQYALLDVLHLSPLYEQLEQELEAHGRRDWMREEMKRLLTPATWTPDPEQAWRRVRGASKSLKRSQMGSLRILARWRELKARERNRARRYVTEDEALIALAQTPTMNRAAFDQVASQLVARDVRQELWQTLQQAQDASAPAAPKRRNSSEHQEFRQKVRALNALTHEIAKELRVVPELLAARFMLEELVEQQPHATVLQGWRREHIGEPLLAALHEL